MVMDSLEEEHTGKLCVAIYLCFEPFMLPFKDVRLNKT